MALRKQFQRIIVLGALLVPSFAATAQQISVFPQTLLSRDTLVRLRVSTLSAFAFGRESVTMLNNKLIVTMRSFENLPDAGPLPPADDVAATSGDVILGRLPQGNYTVEVVFLNRLNGTLSAIGTTQFTVAEDLGARAPGFPAYDFTDLWWNPAESGWGISIHVKRQSLFAAWFAYDASGNPTWYTLQGGAWRTPKSYSGAIYSTHAAPNSGIGPLSALTFALAGNGSIDFDGYDNATFNYTVNGITSFKNITRDIF
jgi:hypothetical protein